MVRRIPTPEELRALLDARLAEVEAAMRAAAAAGVVPGDLHVRHADVLEALTALRTEIEGASE